MSEMPPAAAKAKRVPRWLWALMIALVLMVAAGLILPYFLDADRYRTLIAAAIESETGRAVSLGRIRLRLLPRVGFVVEDFRLGNPPGFGEGNVLTVDTIRGNLALGPLLRRQVQLSSLELVRPKLVLLEDDRGQTNYGGRLVTGRASQGSARHAESSKASAGGQPFQLADIGRIEFTDAEVILARVWGRGQSPVPSLRAHKLSVELSDVAVDPLRPKQWRGDAPLDGVRIELPGWKDPLEFHSGRLTLREGRIESEFRARLGKAADWKGSLHVADIERAVATFDLSTAQLDVEQLLASQAPAQRPPASHAAHAGKSELVAQGRLAAERLHWQAYTANNATAEIRLFTDRIELWPVTVVLYGGTLQISARADHAQVPERFSCNLKARNIDVGKLLAAAPAARGKLSGMGELDLQLFGALSPEWSKSLSGSGSFSVRDGRLPGVNLRGALESLVKLSGVGGDTPFSLIHGDLSVNEGRISSRQIHMDSARGTVDLRGSCSLEGALDYTGQAVLVPGAAGTSDQNLANPIAGILSGVLQRNVSRATVPFSIRGTLAQPQILPGVPQIESPTPAGQTGKAPPQPKSILDLFRRP
jgi:hypothetical protein